MFKRHRTRIRASRDPKVHLLAGFAALAGACSQSAEPTVELGAQSEALSPWMTARPLATAAAMDEPVWLDAVVDDTTAVGDVAIELEDLHGDFIADELQPDFERHDVFEDLGDPVAISPQNYPGIVPASYSPNDGVVELQLTYAALFELLETRAHEALHEQPDLQEFVRTVSGNRFVYHDTVLSRTRVALPTATTGTPAENELLLESDIAVVVREASVPEGGRVHHLFGRLWIKLTPDDTGVAFRAVDGYVKVPELSSGPLPLGAAGAALSGRFDMPALSDKLGLTVLRSSVAHHTFGGAAPDAGVVAFRFATRLEDDLSVWPGERFSALAAAGSEKLALLRLPAGVLQSRTASLVSDAVHSADAKRTDVTDAHCCDETSWRVDTTAPPPAGITHTKASFHVHWETVFSFSARVDLTADVATRPSVTGLTSGGQLVLSNTANVQWNTNSIGLADGSISDEIKGSLDLPPGMVRSGEGENWLVLTGAQVLPPPHDLPHSYYSQAHLTDDSVTGLIAFRERVGEWLELDPSWPLCASQPSSAQLVVVDGNHPSGPPPRLLYPVEVDPPMPVFVQAQRDYTTGANQLVVTLSAVSLPHDRAVRVHVVTDIGEHTWSFDPAEAPDPIQVVSDCNLPIPQPLEEIQDCWMCNTPFLNPLDAIVQPAVTVRNVASQTTVRSIAITKAYR